MSDKEEMMKKFDPNVFNRDRSGADYLRSIHDQFSDKLINATDFYFLVKPEKGSKELWASKEFIVLVDQLEDRSEYLSIHRAHLDTNTGRWTGGISWDELMELKNQCGRGDKFAVEIFPKDKDVINTNNIRHLWLIEDEVLEKIPCLWRPGIKKQSAQCA